MNENNLCYYGIMDILCSFEELFKNYCFFVIMDNLGI